MINKLELLEEGNNPTTIDSELEQEELSILTLKGVGPATYDKLNSNGYESVEAIAAANPKVLAGKCELTEKFSKGLVKNARELLNMGELRTFSDYLNIVRAKGKGVEVRTGISNFDQYFPRGLPEGLILELYGESATGKTQICLSTAIKTAAQGYLVCYLDTKRTLTFNRILQLSEELGVDPEGVMQNIIYFPVNNTSQLMLSIETLRVNPRKKDIALLIIDSATAYYRTEYLGRGQLSERQQVLNHFLSEVKTLTAEANMSVIITNQVMDRPNVMFGDPVTPIGGHVVSHASSYRVHLKKSKAGTLRGIIKSAPDIPEIDFIFKVTNAGVEDA